MSNSKHLLFGNKVLRRLALMICIITVWYFPANSSLSVPSTSTESIFNVEINLHGNPEGDDNAAIDVAGDEHQRKYEKIIRFWANAVCEQTNGIHHLGKVRIFREGKRTKADIQWIEKDWARADTNGYKVSNKHIYFGDSILDPAESNPSAPPLFNALNDSSGSRDPERAGYILAHEWGHYTYGLFDEYPRAPNEIPPAGPSIMWHPLGVMMTSIMNDFFPPTVPPGGDTTNDDFDDDMFPPTPLPPPFQWLNHSTSHNSPPLGSTGFGSMTRTQQLINLKKSGWEVLIQTPQQVLDEGQGTADVRTLYTNLQGEQPTNGDNWFKTQLDKVGEITQCQKDLEILWMTDTLEVQLVLDRSSSMDGEPLEAAKAAAQELVRLMPAGKSALGVVTFDDQVEQLDLTNNGIPDPNLVLMPPGDAADGVKMGINAKINSILSGNLTALYDAADIALTNLINFTPSNNKVASELVFLLSDGLDISSTATEASVINRYQQEFVPLITFRYGNLAPEVLIRLAENTGGLTFQSPRTFEEVRAAFREALIGSTEFTGVIDATPLPAPGGGTATQAFQVDSTLESFTILASYNGSPGDMKFIIQGPGGESLSTPAFDCVSVGLQKTSCSAQVDNRNIQRIGVGNWNVVVTNNTGAFVEVNVSVLSMPISGGSYDLILEASGGNVVTYPNPIIFTASVSRGLRITEINLMATLTDPTGLKSTIMMNDQGINGDATAGDGIYTVILPSKLNGVHNIDVAVNNNDLNARFTATGLLDGPLGGEIVGAPINENFNRTAMTQVVVQNAPEDFTIKDDHPNFPLGTIIPADNTRIPGSIDFSGDTDFFNIINVDVTQDLLVRVSFLTLGMDPKVTLFLSDGNTVLATGDLTSNQSSNGYLALSIPASEVDPTGVMVAKVEHRNSGASQGTYQFSGGPIKDFDFENISIKVGNGKKPKPINLKSKGVLPVAILTTDDFDATKIDPLTVSFGANGPKEAHGKGHYEDVDDDGDQDLILHFSTQEIGLTCGDSMVSIFGQTFEGIQITGSDNITTIGCQ